MTARVASALVLVARAASALVLVARAASALALVAQPASALALVARAASALALVARPASALALVARPASALALVARPASALALVAQPASALALVALAALLGCDPASAPEPQVGSNSNWLKACTADPQCGEQPACRCGACTTECTRDEDCGELPDARCAQDSDPAVWAQCQSVEPSLSKGVCLPRCAPGDCKDGQACIAGACVLATVPDNAFCEPIAQRSAGDRKAEDELLEALQSLRTKGGTVCGTAAAAAAAPELRFDTRLLCAARVFATELQTTHATSIVDSEGRSSDQRMALAGYGSRQWFEAFAVLAPSVDAALDTMLSQVSACNAFVDPLLTDVGIASAGDAFVITLGRE